MIDSFTKAVYEVSKKQLEKAKPYSPVYEHAKKTTKTIEKIYKKPKEKKRSKKISRKKLLRKRAVKGDVFAKTMLKIEEKEIPSPEALPLKKTPSQKLQKAESEIWNIRKDVGKQIKEGMKNILISPSSSEEKAQEITKLMRRGAKVLMKTEAGLEKIQNIKRRIKELEEKGYKFKETEKGLLPYKPLTPSQKATVALWKHAAKGGGVTTPEEMKKLMEEVEREYESMPYPSFEKLKEKYYSKLPWYQKVATSATQSAIKTVAGIVTFPEFVAEEGIGRLYTLATKRKAERVEIIPVSEKISKKLSFVSPRNITPGLVEASISSAMKRSTKDLGKLAKHPVEAVAATAGELFTFWAAGKGISAVARAMRKGISKVVTLPERTHFRIVESGIKKGKEYVKLKPGVTIKGIRAGRITLKKFRTGKIVKIQDIYGHALSRAMTLEKTAKIKAGFAKVKPGSVSVGTERAVAQKIAESAKPWARVTAIESYMPKKISFEPYMTTIEKLEAGRFSNILASTGVRGRIFRRAWILRKLEFKGMKVGKPMGGILIHETKDVTNISKAAFSDIASKISFTKVSIPLTKISMPLTAISMPKISKPMTMSGKGLIEISMPKISTEIKTGMSNISKDFRKMTKISMPAFSTERRRLTVPSMLRISTELSKQRKEIENISEFARAQKVEYAELPAFDVIREQEKAVEQIQFEQREQAEKPIVTPFGIPSVPKFFVPKFIFPEFIRREKKSYAEEFIENWRRKYEEFIHPVKYLF